MPSGGLFAPASRCGPREQPCLGFGGKGSQKYRAMLVNNSFRHFCTVMRGHAHTGPDPWGSLGAHRALTVWTPFSRAGKLRVRERSDLIKTPARVRASGHCCVCVGSRGVGLARRWTQLPGHSCSALALVFSLDQVGPFGVIPCPLAPTGVLAPWKLVAVVRQKVPPLLRPEPLRPSPGVLPVLPSFSTFVECATLGVSSSDWRSNWHESAC